MVSLVRASITRTPIALPSAESAPSIANRSVPRAPPDTTARPASTHRCPTLRANADPASSYVAQLLAKGNDAILKKIGEEAAETLLAGKDGDKLHIVRETADLWFHTLVMLSFHGLGPEDVVAELHRREGISGLDEKAARRS